MERFPYLHMVRQYAHIRSELQSLRSQATTDRILSKEDLLTSISRKDDWFLLGSGSSVLGLTPSDWEVIRQSRSIGMNAWLFHTFIPDVLAFEEVHSSSLQSLRDAMSVGLSRIATSNRTPLILKFREKANSYSLPKVQVPPQLLGQLRTYGRFQIPNFERISDLRRGIEFAYAADTVGLVPASLLIDHGASVARMAHLAVRSGAKRIILVGVDLSGSKYFYEEDSKFLSQIGLAPFFRTHRESLHGTETPRAGSGEILRFLGELRFVLKRSRGVDLVALNPTKYVSAVVPEISLVH